MQEFYCRDRALAAAGEVNQMTVDTMVQIGLHSPNLAAALFGCSDSVVRKLLALQDTRHGRMLLQAMARSPSSLFDYALVDTGVNGDKSRFVPQLSEQHAQLVVSLNRRLILAAARASATDDTALLALHLAPPVADMLRVTAADKLLAMAERLTWSLATPRFNERWLDMVAHLDTSQHYLVPFLVATIADEYDAKPLLISLGPTAERDRRSRIVECDERLIQLARHAGRCGATPKVATIIFPGTTNNSVVRTILREQVRQWRATKDPMPARTKCWASAERRLVAAATALLLLRLIRAGYPICEAVLFAFEHHRLFALVSGHDLQLRFRDIVVNLLVPLVNRRCHVQLAQDIGSASLVLESADREMLIGLHPPQIALLKRGAHKAPTPAQFESAKSVLPPVKTPAISSLLDIASAPS